MNIQETIPKYCGIMARFAPAISLDGSVLELDSTKVVFNYDKSLSPSNANKCALKEEHRMLQAAKLAHTACEREHDAMAGNVVWVDPNGIVQNFHSSPPASPGGDRAKKFHQKRFSRGASRDGWETAFAVDGNGKVRPFGAVDRPD